MEVRNSTGRTVSILNDDSFYAPSATQAKSANIGFPQVNRLTHLPHGIPRSGSSSPNTPELLRSDSYDSQMSNDALSPLTPPVDYGYSRGYQNENARDLKRPAYVDSRRSNSYDDDHSVASSSAERPVKRYPCRFRDSHGCEKTFTTSGHASRHSKIHTAEKAVQCTFAGCHKKFTRADNMKQHLETHYKDKSRSSRERKAALSEARRNSIPSARGRSSTIASNDHLAFARSDLESRSQYRLTTPPHVSPSWDVRLPMHGRPAAASSPNSGLDALAMAVACQEGGN